MGTVDTTKLHGRGDEHVDDMGLGTIPTSIPPDSNMDAVLDQIVGMLVLPWPTAFKQIHSSPFISHVKEILELHSEVHFCMWAMNLSLSVYMKLLNFVDIKIRKEISNIVSRFLSEWKGARDTQLADALDELIISEFRKHAIADIPDMERLQQDKDYQMLSSTVASYVKDIAMNLDSARQNDVDSTIDMIFPPSKDFIGRCFFPRLASVSSKLLDLIRGSLQQLDDSEASNDSTKSSLSTVINSPIFE